MVKTSTCQELFNGHCDHWGLSDAAHALTHAQQRRIEEVVAADKASGLFMSGKSTSSVSQDGPRLEELLADEGFAVVPAGVYFAVAPDVAARHRPGKSYFDADGHHAIGQAAVDAAAAGRSIDVCSCDRGSGCDVMRILLGAHQLPTVHADDLGSALAAGHRHLSVVMPRPPRDREVSSDG
jgi:hypothetical protein